MAAIMDVAKILFVMLVILACLGGGLVALSGVGLDEAFEADLTEAEAKLTEAQAEELRQRAEYTEARAAMEKAKAEADAIRTTAEELAKHSRLNRRILTWYTMASGARTILSIANIVVWLLALYLYWQQER